MDYYQMLMNYCSDLTIDEMRKVVRDNSVYNNMESYYALIKKRFCLSDDDFSCWSKSDFNFELKRIAVAEVKVLDEIQAKLEAKDHMSYCSYAALASMKEGDIKVNGKELQMLMCIIIDYFYRMAEIDEHSKAERADIKSFLYYMEEKYLRLSDLRVEQKKCYQFMKNLHDDNIVKSLLDEGKKTCENPSEVLRSLQRDAWGIYLEKKTEREDLLRKVTTIKENSKWELLKKNYNVDL